MSDTPLRVAYLVSAYPKISHTFILREILGLEAVGITTIPYSVREPDPSDLLGDIEASEAQRTTYIFPLLKKPLTLIRSHFELSLKHPSRYFRTLWRTVRRRNAGIRALLYQLIYFAEAGLLARDLEIQKADHLHTHFANAGCTVGGIATDILGLNHSFTMHGPTEFFDVEKHQLREKVAQATFVSCISHFCRSQLMLFSHKSDWDKLHIIHCGIDTALYTPQSNRKDQHILFVGRMSGVKGVPLLLDAVSRLKAEFPELKLTLVGDGDEKQELEAQSERLGLQDIADFKGYQSQNEVATHMSEADIFVLPSFAEGLPVVLMEALASETPVITTRIAGVGELVIDGKYGQLIAPGDVDGLVDALRELLKMPKSERREMGELGRLAVLQEFDAFTEAGKLAKLFASYQTRD